MIIIKGNNTNQHKPDNNTKVSVTHQNLKVIITIERVSSDGEKHVEKVSMTEGGYQALKRHFSNL